MMKKRWIVTLFLLTWFIVIVVNFIREIMIVKTVVLSRHNFFESCNQDQAHRFKYLEACVIMETRPSPTNYYLDVLFEALPRVNFFVFFEMSDLFSYQVMSKMIALAICKMVCGDLIMLGFRTMVKKTKRLS